MVTRIGIDPDTKATGLCYTIGDGPPRFLVARAKGALEEDRREGMAFAIHDALVTIATEVRADHDAFFGPVEVAIEWQKLRPMREKNPNAMMAVQAVAGIALGQAIHAFLHKPTIYLPIPSDWRGSMPKDVMHKRWMMEARLTNGEGPLANVPVAALSHCKCALGLVLWLRRGRTIS